MGEGDHRSYVAADHQEEPARHGGGRTHLPDQCDVGLEADVGELEEAGPRHQAEVDPTQAEDAELLQRAMGATREWVAAWASRACERSR